MQLPASYNPTELPGSAAFDLFADCVEGVLTDEHAASSHGQPVFVRDTDGVPMGVADLGGVPLSVALRSPGDYAAGEPDGPIDPERYRFACRAAATGYNVAALEGHAYLIENAGSRYRPE